MYMSLMYMESTEADTEFDFAMCHGSWVPSLPICRTPYFY